MRRAVVLAALVGCAHPSMSAAPLPDDAIRALPAASRHVFVSPDPTWVPHVSYQRLRPDAFVTIPAAEIGDAHDLYKEIRYTDGAGDDAALRKLVRWRPDGRLALELDRVGDESFERRFDADGAYASYLHCRIAGAFQACLAGYSQNPARTQHTAFAGGHGALTIWNAGGATTTTHYLDGYPLLEIERDAGAHVLAARANVGQDSLRWTPAVEHLDLTARREAWTKSRDQPAVAELVHDADGGDGPPGDELHQRIIDAARVRIDLRPSSDAQRAANTRAIAEAYPLRRDAFLHAFEAQLAASGNTWDQLGLDAMRVAP